MKRLIILLVAGLFMVSAASALAGGESEVYYWDDAIGDWVHNPADVNDRYARLFRTGDLVLDSCNAGYWEIPVTVRASIAQWVKFKLDWNVWEWFIRKPGCYAGNSIEATVWSNGDVEVGYMGFAKLMPMLDENQDHKPIDIWYSYETGGGVWDCEYYGWTHADDMDNHTSLIEDVIGDNPDNPWPLHYGVSWKLWSKVCTDVCNSACDYWDDATITITLKNQKPWLVFLTGEWGI
jgi:hypothetical protein